MSWLATGSPTVREHLWRGGVGALLILQAFAFLAMGHGAVHLLMAASQLAFAVVVLRGCPMCWAAGLVTTLARPASGRSEDVAA